jgi:hypothetical protein
MTKPLNAAVVCALGAYTQKHDCSMSGIRCGCTFVSAGAAALLHYGDVCVYGGGSLFQRVRIFCVI